MVINEKLWTTVKKHLPTQTVRNQKMENSKQTLTDTNHQEPKTVDNS